MEILAAKLNPSILSLVLLAPLFGALLVFLCPAKGVKPWALAISLLDFVLSLHLPYHFDSSSAALQYPETHSWIPSLGIQFALGIDGISLWLVLLTTFLGPLVVLSAWNAIKIHERAFYAFLLALQTAMLGAFMASDIFLFFIFWEAMLIPMYFIIGIWGGERRIYATVKFFIYSMSGSLFMMVGMIALFIFCKQQLGHYSANIEDLYRLNLTDRWQIMLFGAFALAFAIKVPLFLLHTWLPDAHVEAPTAGSVILAGVLLKMGSYGFVRLALPLFPQGFMFFQPLLIGLAIAGIICGALVAMVQPDMKKLVAYSSVSHLGFVMLGIFVLTEQGLQGGLYQMLNHGVSTGALFLLVGMIYERRHTRQIAEFGGLAKSMPLFAAFFLIVTLSSIGLPGTNGFIGEFLILLGAFRKAPVYALLAGTGIILGAVYMLWMYQRVMFGALSKRVNEMLEDLSTREVLLMLPLLVMIVVMGLFPQPFFKTMAPSIEKNLAQIQTEKSNPNEETHPKEMAQKDSLR